MKFGKFRLVNKKPIIILFVLLIMATVATVAHFYYWNVIARGPSYMLMLGIDARGEETMARADTIILVSVDRKNNKAAFLSIPRDTLVTIPQHGVDKINHTTVYGGPELTAAMVSQLVDTKIDKYVLLNFQGFKQIVDAIGGVTINVEHNMFHADPEDGLAYQINLEMGEQRRLDGDKALQYVRYRDYPMGDITRLENQHKMIRAVGNEVLQPSAISKLPDLIREINSNVVTNLSVTEMLALASIADSIEEEGIITETLPGNLLDMDGVSYWEPIPPTEAKQLLDSLLKQEPEQEPNETNETPEELQP